MNEVVFLLWIILWIVFLVMSIIERRGIVFGFLAGLWILFLGVYLYIDGFQFLSGVEMVSSGGMQTISYTYDSVVLPFSNYGLLWAIPFILLGIYILYLAVTKKLHQPTV